MESYNKGRGQRVDTEEMGVGMIWFNTIVEKFIFVL